MGTVLENLHDFCGTWFYWFPDFAQSPGFAGCLAVGAAGLAYHGTTKNARQEQWWKRAEYALNLTLSAEETTQITGLEMLDALKSKSKREIAFIDAATQWFLDKEAEQVFSGPAVEEPPAEFYDDVPAPPGRRARILGAVRGIFSRPRA
ncbi:hypothetical protein ABIE21_001072 [Conyzicola nivalis]|uniref:Uncharacterized protein n=1 Tax=Conyzicola nivalis TaxID=1477021 RepID=A0ABV2QKL7_9MICO